MQYEYNTESPRIILCMLQLTRTQNRFRIIVDLQKKKLGGLLKLATLNLALQFLPNQLLL